jgi:hypothetical protein
MVARGTMGLHPEGSKVALHAALETGLSRNRTHAPVCRPVGRLGMQGGLNQLRHPIVIDRARGTRANIVTRTGDAAREEPRVTCPL